MRWKPALNAFTLMFESRIVPQQQISQQPSARSTDIPTVSTPQYAPLPWMSTG